MDMKQNNPTHIYNKYKALLAAFLLAAAPAAAQHTLQSGAVVKDALIARSRDSVVVRLDIDLTSMQVESNRSTVILPALRTDGGQTLRLPALEVMGRCRNLYYERNERRVYADPLYQAMKRDKGEPQTVTYRTSLLYESWMDNAELSLTEDLCGCGEVTPGTLMSLRKTDLAYTPYLAYVQPPVEIKDRSLEGQSFLDFVVNRTDINPSYRRNPEELARIHASIDTIAGDADFRITRIYLKGYASPEDTYKHNTYLAKGRTEALKKYVMKKYGFADTLFTTAYEPENWEGLRRYVAASSLTDKDEILALIDSDMEPDPKEHAIRARHPESYRHLLAECYPALRRTDYKIAYTVRGFNEQEAKTRLAENPWKLSLKEMLAVAQTYEPGSADFVRVFEAMVRVYPDSRIANLNMANALLTRGEAGQALLFLDKAGDSAEAENARGVAALLQKRYDEAEQHLRRAVKQGLSGAEINLRQTVVVE